MLKKIFKINCDYKKNSEFLIKGLKRNNTRLIVAGESHILMTKGWQSFDRSTSSWIRRRHLLLLVSRQQQAFASPPTPLLRERGEVNPSRHCEAHSKKYEVKEKDHCGSLSRFFYRDGNLIMMSLLFIQSGRFLSRPGRF